jgi:hypothetical protein
LKSKRHRGAFVACVENLPAKSGQVIGRERGPNERFSPQPRLIACRLAPYQAKKNAAEF